MVLRLIIRNWSFSILIFTSILGIILNKFGWLPEKEIFSFILLLICTFSVNQIIMHEKTNQKLDEIAVNIGHIKEVDSDEFYTLLKSSVINAKKTIDLTLHQSTNPLSGIKTRRDYFKEMDSIVKADKVRVRRITTGHLYLFMKTISVNN